MGEGKKYVICEKELEVYRRDMLENERSRATIEKYIRDVRAFCRWNGEKLSGDLKYSDADGKGRAEKECIQRLDRLPAG